MTDKWIDEDGRLKVGAPCKLDDGREAVVVRRWPIQSGMTLGEGPDGRTEFRSCRYYGLTLRAGDGEQVRKPRIILPSAKKGGKA